ncbi:MAG: hypothetical protein AAF466_08690, partial [Bacteroidota bacterium]
VERGSGETFEAVGAQLKLRDSCNDAVEDCLTLIGGAAYHPIDWSGDIGEGQCECDRCGRAPSGTYRIVVSSCNGAHQVRSGPFDL